MSSSNILSIPVKGNVKLKSILDVVDGDVELQTLWRCSNVLAISSISPTQRRLFIGTPGKRCMRAQLADWLFSNSCPSASATPSACAAVSSSIISAALPLVNAA